ALALLAQREELEHRGRRRAVGDALDLREQRAIVLIVLGHGVRHRVVGVRRAGVDLVCKDRRRRRSLLGTCRGSRRWLGRSRRALAAAKRRHGQRQHAARAERSPEHATRVHGWMGVTTLVTCESKPMLPNTSSTEVMIT